MRKKIRKLILTATILTKKGRRKEIIHTEKFSIIDNIRLIPPPCFLDEKEPLLPRRDSLSLTPGNEVRWYRITSVS